MFNDLERAVSCAKDAFEKTGVRDREIYVFEHVLRKMLSKGAKKIQMNCGRFVNPKSDGRRYEHKIRYKGLLYVCINNTRID